MQRKKFQLSRRDFLGRSLMAGAVFPRASMFSAQSDFNSIKETAQDDTFLISIKVSAPAGPPPLGSPAEVSIPLQQGIVFRPEGLAIYSPQRLPVIMQAKTSATWPDGSIRWLCVAFEPAAGPGVYVLKKGKSAEAADLLRRENGHLIVNSGAAVLTFNDDSNGWLESISGIGKEGKLVPLSTGHNCSNLLFKREDGKEFQGALGKYSGQLIVEENGPMKVSVRCQGRFRAPDGNELFDYILRWTVYRGRPEVHVTATWINSSGALSEKISDLRWLLPFEFHPERLVFGCERGTYDGPYLKDWPVYILQEDYDCYWARTLNPNRSVQNLSSGGCNGGRAPGWMYVQNFDHCLGIWVPNFHEEYPNEIFLMEGELSVGLWPGRAAHHLASKPILPSDPFGSHSYEYAKYWPVIPHPYLAFFDAEKQCLDARRGMAKTQDIVLSVWAGKEDMPTFERKWWNKALQPVRGHLDPVYVANTNALGILSARDAKAFPQFEQLFDESFGWLDRHIDVLRCYGKFDYGDFKYMTAGTDYMCHPGTKWGEMGEMPREGYWHNNERDPLLGLLLYYFRTGNPKAWERCGIVARHLFDVDISHHPRWGMWTHSYGHCYLAQGRAGEPDHSWLLGMLHWAGISGDPVMKDWITRCGKDLRCFPIEWEKADARSVSVYLHMMCQVYQLTGQAEFLEASHAPAKILLKYQKSNGSWPAYLGNPSQTIEGFVEHAVMALADYYAIHRDDSIRASIDKAVEFLFGEEGEKPVDVGESSLALYALAILGNITGSSHYVALASTVLNKLYAQLNLSPDLVGRGDPWAEWGINNSDMAKLAGRPEQFLGQTRPLSPASTLAYGQPALGLLARKNKPNE